MIRRVRWSVVLIFAWSGAFAGTDEVSRIAVRDCTLQAVHGAELMRDTQRQGDLAAQQLPLLNTLEALANKAPIPDKPVSEQLSIRDNVKFAETRQRLLSIGALQLIESDRLRDVEAVVHMVRIADENYRWDRRPSEGSDAVYQMGLDVLRAVLPHVSANAKFDLESCSLAAAIQKIENESISRLAAMDIGPAVATLERLATAYNMKPIDRTKLSQSDKESFDSAMRIGRLGMAERTYGEDLERLQLVARAILLSNDSSLRDLADSGGDLGQIGAGIKRLIADKRLDEKTIAALGTLQLIGQKIPSAKSKQISELARKLRDASSPNTRK
jgi:hypothetical protein